MDWPGRTMMEHGTERSVKRPRRLFNKATPASRDTFHGYLFKVLEGQGPAAPLGAISYKINGAMIGGFALLAYPAVYQGSGVKTFMVSQDGVVWEKDLGPNTLQVASATELFNPDKTWKPVLDDR